MWDSRAIADHYIKQNWNQRIFYEPGTNSVQSIPLVDPNNIFLPPLHIKLGLIKNFVKAMGKTNSEGFQYKAMSKTVKLNYPRYAHVEGHTDVCYSEDGR
ncbi:hypothetical protein QTP88_003554 [Uroleucon formosanum]